MWQDKQHGFGVLAAEERMGEKIFRFAFRVSRSAAINWQSASDGRSQTDAALSKGVRWLDR